MPACASAEMQARRAKLPTMVQLDRMRGIHDRPIPDYVLLRPQSPQFAADRSSGQPGRSESKSKVLDMQVDDV
jgi:hypothetical protein